MGSLQDDAGILKVQEHLINKSDHNRSFKLRLGKLLTVIRISGKVYRLPILQELAEAIESNQLCVNGYSRKQYLVALKDTLHDIRNQEEEERK